MVSGHGRGRRGCGGRGGPRSGVARPARETAAAWDPEALVAQCLAHDEGAWDEFLRRYARLIYSTVHRVGLPPDECEEAFQASVVAIYEQLAGLRSSSALVSWIIGVTWRQAVNCIRKRRREVRTQEVGDGLLRESLEPPVRETPPDEARLLLERAQQAQEAMASLSERCRRLLGYLFFEDPTPDYTEIARREQAPIGSLGPTRARCIERLRRYFRERGWME